MAAKDRTRYWFTFVIVLAGLCVAQTHTLLFPEQVEPLDINVKPFLHDQRQVVRKRNVEENKNNSNNTFNGKHIRVVTEVIHQPRRSYALLDMELSDTKCPAGSRVRPCDCSSLAFGISVICSDAENRDQLINALKTYRFVIMAKTKFEDYGFELRNTDFDGIQVRNLEFYNADVKITGDPGSYTFAQAIKTRERLMSVTFINSTVDLGETSMATGGMTLNNLELVKVTFKNYNFAWFDQLRLNQLNIYDSPGIDQPVAFNITGLKRFQYTRCNLVNLTSDMFPKDRSELREINLSDNRIASFPMGLFDNMPHLEELSLRQNKFVTLDTSTFKKILPTVTFLKLRLDDNMSLKCENIQWVRALLPEERAKLTGTCVDQRDIDVKISDQVR